METSAKTKITVETVVNAQVEKVWSVWSKPEHVTQWCQASEDWHAPYADNDLRPDGKFKTRMEAKDGSFGFDFEGVYTNVKPLSEIDYVIADGRTVETVFTKQGDKTKVTQTFDAEEINPVEIQRGGWQAILDNFRKYTESLS